MFGAGGYKKGYKKAMTEQLWWYKAVINACGDTIKKLVTEVEDLQNKGQSPADYSLGFLNGLLFVHHRLIGSAGAPRFYDRSSTVGHLPIPVTFSHEEVERNNEIAQYISLLENVKDAAATAVKVIENGPYADPAFTNLLESLKPVDRFLNEEESNEASTGSQGEELGVVAQADQGSPVEATPQQEGQTGECTPDGQIHGEEGDAK